MSHTLSDCFVLSMHRKKQKIAFEQHLLVVSKEHWLWKTPSSDISRSRLRVVQNCAKLCKTVQNYKARLESGSPLHPLCSLEELQTVSAALPLKVASGQSGEGGSRSMEMTDNCIVFSKLFECCLCHLSFLLQLLQDTKPGSNKSRILTSTPSKTIKSETVRSKSSQPSNLINALKLF